jgi:hypothetical protein
MTTKYKLVKEENQSKWNDFIKTSKYSTIYQYLAFLDAVSANVCCYFVYKASELRAAIAVIESEDGFDLVNNDLVIHNGVVFGNPMNHQNHAQVISEHYNIIDFLAKKFYQIYRNINITLSPEITDIRPFQWVNYGESLPKYNINIRYTSIIDIEHIGESKILEENSVYSKLLKVRRQSIRYSIRDKVNTLEEFNIDSFCNLYKSTMQRQNKSEKNIIQIRKLILSLYHNNLLRMFISRNLAGEIGSIACFAIDHNRAHYLFGANNPDMRDKHTGSAVLWSGFLALSEAGVKEVDLEGVNSPNRGWFKLSFGGNLVPYFNVTLEK